MAAIPELMGHACTVREKSHGQRRQAVVSDAGRSQISEGGGGAQQSREVLRPRHHRLLQRAGEGETTSISTWACACTPGLVRCNGVLLAVSRQVKLVFVRLYFVPRFISGRIGPSTCSLPCSMPRLCNPTHLMQK